MEIQNLRHNFSLIIHESFEWVKHKIIKWLGIPQDYQYDYWFLRESISACYTMVKQVQVQQKERHDCVHDHQMCWSRYVALQNRVKILEERLSKYE